jgi:hypothetical protein
MKSTLLLGIAIVSAACTFVTACDAVETTPGHDEPALVGTWTHRWDTPLADLADRFTFGKDGSFAYDETRRDPTEGDHHAGTYEARDDVFVATVTTKDGRRARMTYSYYASDTTFALTALHPEGAHDGLVGTWKGHAGFEWLSATDEPSMVLDLTLQFRGDGTYTRTDKGSIGTEAIDGLEEAGYVVDAAGALRLATTDDPRARPSDFVLIDDAVIGDRGALWSRD